MGILACLLFCIITCKGRPLSGLLIRKKTSRSNDITGDHLGYKIRRQITTERPSRPDNFQSLTMLLPFSPRLLGLRTDEEVFPVLLTLLKS